MQYDHDAVLVGGIKGGFAEYSFTTLLQKYNHWQDQIASDARRKKAKIVAARKARAAKKQADLEKEEALRYDIRKPKHKLINNLPLVRQVKRIRDAPPMGLDDIQDQQELLEWVNWAHGVWDAIEVERQGGGIARRNRSSVKRRKTSTTPDRKLANWDAVQPPLCIRDFAGLDQSIVMKLLLSWDFFVRFRFCLEYSELEQVTFDAFLAALHSPHRTAVLDTYCSSILRLVIKPKKTRSNNRRRNNGAICNLLTWESFLCVYLAEKINVHDDMTEFQDVMNLLHEETFYVLSPARRIAVVLMLCQEALSSPWLREFTDNGFASLEKARKASDSIGHDAKAARSYMEQNGFDVCSTMVSMLDSVCKENASLDKNHPDRKTKKFQDKLEKATMTTDVYAMNTRLKKAFKVEMEKAVEDAHAHYRECKERYPIRTEPLGMDRYYSRYWLLEDTHKHAGRVFVEFDPDSYEKYFASAYASVSGGNSKGLYGFYQTQQQIAELISFLNEKGVDESKLKSNLVRRFGNAAECKWFPDGAKLGAVAEEALYAHSYEQILESVRPLQRSQFVSEDLFRCPICQECVDAETRGHCEVCHESMDVHTNRKLSLFTEHQNTCKDLFGIESSEAEETLTKSYIASLAAVDRAELAAMNDFGDVESPEPEEAPAASSTSSSSSSSSSENKKMDVDDDNKASSSPSGGLDDLSEEQIALVTTRRWWMEEPSPVFSGSSYFQATRLSEVDAAFRALKAVLFDVESAIPFEAQNTYNSDKARKVWIRNLQGNYSLAAVVDRVQEILMTLEPKWLRVWFDHDAFATNLAGTRTLPELARHIFFLDQALCYSRQEKDAADEKYAEMEEGESESDSADGADKASAGGCKQCRKNVDAHLTLVCDECDSEYHTYCLRPKLKKVPDGDWFCAICIARANARARKQQREAARRAKEEDDNKCCVCDGSQSVAGSNDILFCDGCDRGYHQQCEDPPVTKVPAGNWYCSACGSGAEASSSEASEAVSEYSEGSADDSAFDEDGSSSSSETSNSSSSDSESSSEDESDEVCAVCGSNETTSRKNPVVTCQGDCEISCHKDCVGISARAKEWECDRCRLADSKTQCALCPTQGGAITVIAKSGKEFNGKYAHVICALCIPAVSFGDVTKRSPVTKVDKISPADFAEHECTICHDSSGICVDCADRRCSEHFHASCAASKESGCAVAPAPKKKNRFLAYCPRHARKSKK